MYKLYPGRKVISVLKSLQYIFNCPFSQDAIFGNPYGIEIRISEPLFLPGFGPGFQISLDPDRFPHPDPESES